MSGLVLILVAAIAAGWLAHSLARPIAWLLLAIELVITAAIAFLVWGYRSIRYELSGDSLVIHWGLRREEVRLDQISSVVPLPEAIRDGGGQRLPFWSGYYVGRWQSAAGPVDVVATMPARRQLLVTAGERRFAISPERPVLFLEELARSRGEPAGSAVDASNAMVGSWLPDHDSLWSPPAAPSSLLGAVESKAASDDRVVRDKTVTGDRRDGRFALLADPKAIGLLGIAVLINVAMVIYILTQYHSLPQSIALHWNVNGYPDVIGSPRHIWTVPIITALVTVANFVLAGFVAAYDRFISRFLLGACVLVQIVAWVGLLTLI